MRIAVVDNTKGIEEARMTPLLVDIIQNMSHTVCVVEDSGSLRKCGALDGIILSGGPAKLSSRTNDLLRHSVNFTALLLYPMVPVLGICFGMQLMCAAYGGSIMELPPEKRKNGDIIEVVGQGFSHILPHAIVKGFAYHDDHVCNVPSPFTITAKSIDGTVQAVEWAEGQRFGVQFHPEGSTEGRVLISRFLDFCSNSAEPYIS
jgi:GMP synthase (glutamine-hydrolysing)